ncbi:MAG TPA: radical SAM protein [Verrucomicrobiae bacterium]|nr:radical SAM protein [Verrucomicrobiae bacterium]
MNEHTMPAPEVLRLTGAAQKRLHERSAEAARSHFGREVFVRAVVEISNFCRENCSYCGMRRDNRSLHRFRARHEQIAELLIHHRPGSVTDVNIQAGEDPVAVREVALPLIRALRKHTNLGISVCLGILSPALYEELKAAGANLYIMKFEIANRHHYTRMHAPGTFEKRVSNIRHLAGSGWRVSSGFIAGLPGQTDEHLLENFQLAAELPLDGISVSPFIPGDETPLSSAPMSDIDLTLNCMAALRLMRPDWVIPSVSALNLAGPGNGYRRGLRTGANLATINLTPSEFRGDYLLYKRERFIMTEERILGAIEAEGLAPSKRSLAEYYRGRANAAPTVGVADTLATATA